jgi:hypothetical protein
MGWFSAVRSNESGSILFFLVLWLFCFIRTPLNITLFYTVRNASIASTLPPRLSLRFRTMDRFAQAVQLLSQAEASAVVLQQAHAYLNEVGRTVTLPTTLSNFLALFGMV